MARKLVGLSTLFIFIRAGAFLNGCAIGTTNALVSHNPLNMASQQRQGNIFLMKFEDKRNVTEYIGNKRNGFGMVLGHIGIENPEKIDVLLTNYFAEALQAAGYKVDVEKPEAPGLPADKSYDLVVKGEINEFWMDLYMAVWHSMTIKMMALNPKDKSVLWSKDFHGEQKNVLWIGATGEYEKVIGEAVTNTLNQAVTEFCSEEFYQTVKKPK
jgi:hypothetical protein